MGEEISTGVEKSILRFAVDPNFTEDYDYNIRSYAETIDNVNAIKAEKGLYVFTSV